MDDVYVHDGIEVFISQNEELLLVIVQTMFSYIRLLEPPSLTLNSLRTKKTYGKYFKLECKLKIK